MVPLFQPLGDDYLQTLLDAMQSIKVPRDNLVIRKGEQGKTFYVVCQGTCSARANGRILKKYVQGDYFGELSLLKDEPRAADVLVDSQEAKLLVLEREAFCRLLGPLQDIMKQQADRGYSNPGNIAFNPMWCSR
eukprot:TRINITY_DN64213_c0_g1_i1.p1 TRINITY_DN64213_c0_g1~~TRINITY_DN64213_c0_g1_i1.p1  ORF type:complete len:134 (-),score=17.39 TRINITY_DN64213_c0_g1_i1:310-711(-)